MFPVFKKKKKVFFFAVFKVKCILKSRLEKHNKMSYTLLSTSSIYNMYIMTHYWLCNHCCILSSVFTVNNTVCWFRNTIFSKQNKPMGEGNSSSRASTLIYDHGTEVCEKHWTGASWSEDFQPHSAGSRKSVWSRTVQVHVSQSALVCSRPPTATSEHHRSKIKDRHRLRIPRKRFQKDL